MANGGCRTCEFVRLYLFIAAALILLIAFVPTVAEVVWGRMPGPLAIALVIPAVGIPSFIFRYIAWKRGEKS